MIEFVDIKNGKVFHVDPTNMEKDGVRVYDEAPYTFWFENGQSTNLNYVRKICFISDKMIARVKLSSPVFSILRMGQDIPLFNEKNQESINSKNYLDLQLLKTDSYSMRGYRHKDFYVYMLYIMASAQDEGEYRETFTINGDEYEVGADFYSESEILKSNLENFDISIPESIQKAIYDVNVHEESNDNITLNRKYKELLMNYWDIVANKGSYKSLVNSLAWFEWGDLVRIEELWKHHQQNLTDYFSEPLNRPLTEEFFRQFVNNSKTTYIGLYLALSKVTFRDGHIEYQDSVGTNQPISAESSGNHIYSPFQSDYDKMAAVGFEPAFVDDENPAAPQVYFNHARVTDVIPYRPTEEQIGDEVSDPWVVVYNENMPHLELITAKWNILDLCLKMTLLGNFYSTYFVPIHMDTIHSTIEHWVFAYAYKMLEVHEVNNNISYITGGAFEMTCTKEAQVMQHTARVYSDTLFKAPRITDGTPTNIFGMETVIRHEPDPNPDHFNPLLYFYGGTVGKVHCSGKIPAQDKDDRITSYRLTWSSDGGDTGEITGTISSLDPTLWFVKDRKPVYEPGHFVMVEPGIYDRPYAADTGTRTRNHKQEMVPDPETGEMVIPAILEDYYPVARLYRDQHNWVMLDGACNYVAVMNPDRYESPMIPGTDLSIPFVDEWVKLDGERFDSYPDHDTFTLQYLTNIDFDLGIMSAGHYTMMFEFHTSGGNVWTKTCRTTITDDARNKIDLYKIKPRDLQEVNLNTDLPWFNAFQMQVHNDPIPDGTDSNLVYVGNTPIYTPYREHSIFIGNHTDLKLNHTVIFRIPLGNENVDIKIRKGNTWYQCLVKDILEHGEECPIGDTTLRGLGYMWIINKPSDSGEVSFVGIRDKFQEAGDVNITDVTTSFLNNAFMQPYTKHGKFYFVADYRFHPILHELEKFDNHNFILAPGEVIYADPILKYSRDIDECTWEFTNESIQRSAESWLVERKHYFDGRTFGDNGLPRIGGPEATMVSPYEVRGMAPGYYTIQLRYSKGGEKQEVTYDSAFLMAK